jgi:acid phosphatase
MTAAAWFVTVAGCSQSNPAAPVTPNDTQLAQMKQKINHVIIIYQENWGFDGLYGHFPSANGYANAVNFAQVDANGNPIAMIGQVLNGGTLDPNFSSACYNQNLTPAPFNLSTCIPTTTLTGDPNHNFYIQQAEIDGGKMDRYLAYPGSGQGALTFGYWDATNFAEGQLAQQYTLADNFHQSTFGGSFLNNMWAACACTPSVPSAPAKLFETVDANGNPLQIGGSEGRLTPDGYVVNTSYSTQVPQFFPGGAPSNLFVPPLTYPTFGDRLNDANVTWKFYSGGLTNALAGNPDPTFQPHHQSYLYFKNYAPGAPLFTKHIVDFDDPNTGFLHDLASGTLPSVAWLKVLGKYNEHPGYASIAAGQTYVSNLVSSIQLSSAWKDSLIVIFYDEAGGHYDHVPPLAKDRWGPSTRVPAIFISPFMKRSFIDHTNYEVLSLLKTIELRFGVFPLAERDYGATPILAPFDFSQATPAALAHSSFRPLPPVPPVPAPTGHRPGNPITDFDIDD